MMVEITTVPNRTPSRVKTIGMWVFRVVIALMFLTTASLHLSGKPHYMVEEFDIVGLGQWLRYFTGTLELVGAVLVLIPRTSAIGGLVLLTVDIGAFVAEVTALHVDWIHTVVLGLILVLFIYLQRDSLTNLRSLRSASH